MQAFLGFTNFYCWFIHNFSALVHPLFDLTKSNMPWSWNNKEHRAFEVLKAAVTSALVLMPSQDSELFYIKANSLDFTTGAVLSQWLPGDEKWHSVIFYNKFLSLVEWNYEIYNKKILAIIHALEEWRHFLEGVRYPVEIWTNYKNLEYFMTAKKLNCPQACCSLYLACFDFMLAHCPGCSMEKPDILSQRPVHGTGTSDNEDITLLYLEMFTIWTLEGVELKGIKKNVLSGICKGNHNRDQEEPHSLSSLQAPTVLKPNSVLYRVVEY